MITIKINDVNVTEYIPSETLRIVDEITNQINSASFAFNCINTSVSPITGQTITITDDATTLFAGRLTRTDETFIPPNSLSYQVECVDFTRDLDKLLVNETYSNQYAGDIIKDIITKYTGYLNPEWTFPTGFSDPDTEWTDEANIYDEDDDTYGYDVIDANDVFWVIDEGVYENKSYLVSQTSTATDIFFKPYGGTAYMIDNLTSMIYQYTLTEGWNIDTMVYAEKSFDVSTEDTFPRCMFIKPDGLSMYVVGFENGVMYQYTLGTAWDVSTAVYTGKSAAVGYSMGIHFEENGDWVYNVDWAGTIYQWDMTTSWDISTATADLSKDITAETEYASGIAFNTDGTKMWVYGKDNQEIYQYTLGTGWNVTTANYDTKLLNVGNIKAFRFDAGVRLHTVGNTDNTVYQYIFPKWGSFIELTFPAVGCDRIKILAQRTAVGIDHVDIDAYYDAAWNHVYQGDFNDMLWTEAGIDEIESLTKVRVRFANTCTIGADSARLYEVSMRTYTAGFSTTNVEDGSIVSEISFSYIPVSKAIMTLANNNDFNWYVDYDKDLHFFSNETETAPFDLDDNQANYKDLSVSVDNSQVRNRIYVKSSSIEDVVGEAFVGDGTTTSWTGEFKGEVVPLTKLDTDFELKWDATKIQFSHNDTYLAVGYVEPILHDFKGIKIFKREGDTFTALADPDLTPNTDCLSVCWSNDDTYLGWTSDSGSFTRVYKRSNDVFTLLDAFDDLPPDDAFDCAFSPCDTYYTVAHRDSPYVTIWKRADDVFTKLADPASLPTGEGRGIAWSPDGTYLAIAHDTSPYVTIYKREGDTFTEVAEPADLPAGIGNSVSFSPCGTYLVVAHDTTPFITIYSIANDVFTKLANPADLPTGNANDVDFAENGIQLAVGHDTTPFITIYKYTAGTFTKSTDPDLPVDEVLGVDFSTSSTYLAVGHDTSPYFVVYKQYLPTLTKNNVYKTVGITGDDAAADYEYMYDAENKLLELGDLPLDVGSDSTNRADNTNEDLTLISGENRVNATGIIDTIKMYVQTTLTECVVGSFYRPDAVGFPNKFTMRDSVEIGGVVQGAERTVTDLVLQVEEGDYLGVHSKTGKWELGDGIATVWANTGKYFPCTDTTFTPVANKAISINGTGTLTAPTSDDELLITYTYFGAPVALIREDTDSINNIKASEGGDGIFEYCIDDSSIMSVEVANEMAKGELLLHSQSDKTVTFFTNNTDIHSGQLITMDSDDRNRTQDFVIQSVELERVIITREYPRIPYVAAAGAEKAYALAADGVISYRAFDGTEYKYFTFMVTASNTGVRKLENLLVDLIDK